MSEYESLLNALKYLSMATAGVSGVVGAVKVTKNQDGTLNRWGQLALLGIVAGTFFSIGIQYVETKKAAIDNAAAAAKAIEASRQQGELLKNATKTLEQQSQILGEVYRVNEGVTDSLDQQRELFTQTKGIAGQTGLISQGVSQSLTNVRAGLEEQRVLRSELGGVALTQKAGLEEQVRLYGLQENVLSNLKRTMNPITPVAMHLTLRYSTADPRFTAYLARLSGEVSALVRQGAGLGSMVVERDASGALKRVRINDRAHLPFFPRVDRSEHAAVVAVNQPTFNMFLNRTRDRRADRTVPSDLTYGIVAWNGNNSLPAGARLLRDYGGGQMEMSLDVNFEHNVIEHEIFTTAIKPEVSRGELISIHDLPGTSMELRISRGGGQHGVPALVSLVFRFGEGYSKLYELNPDTFHKEVADNLLTYFYTFKPEDFPLGG